MKCLLLRGPREDILMLPENLPRLVLNSGYGPDLHVHVIEETGGGGEKGIKERIVSRCMN